MLHDAESEVVNRYTTHSELEQKCKENESPLIKWRYQSVDFDPQMVYFRQDTIKNAFHLSGAIGGAFYSAQIANDNFLNSKMQGGLNCTFSLGYYRQLLYKGKNRIGIDLSTMFTQRNIGFQSNAYHHSYDDIDFDGGKYLRLIDIDNYQESIRRFMIDIPVGLRYDYYDFDSRIVVTAKGKAVEIAVWLDKPVPEELVGDAQVGVQTVVGVLFVETLVVVVVHVEVDGGPLVGAADRYGRICPKTAALAG